jgi:hypothetical protein
MPLWSSPEDIQVDNNDRYNSRPRFSTNTTFNFPLSSESLLFFGKGSYATGDVVFIQDDTISDNIVVDVNVRYWSQEDLDQAQVCTLSRAVGEGFGIFVRS